jgi:hypothetical protein
MRLITHADDVPLLGCLRTSVVIGAPTPRGKIPTERDGPIEATVPTTPREERRHPRGRDAFHRHDTRRNLYAEGLLPPAFAPALPLTPPTLFPQAGESVFDWALRGHGAVTRGSVADSGVQTPFSLSGFVAPGTDDPSTPASSTDSAVDGAVCSARTDAGRSA